MVGNLNHGIHRIHGNKVPTQSLKSKVAKGSIWVLLEKMSGQAVHFVVGMILARLLTPNDYGTVALYAIFFAVAGVSNVNRPVFCESLRCSAGSGGHDAIKHINTS